LTNVYCNKIIIKGYEKYNKQYSIKKNICETCSKKFLAYRFSKTCSRQCKNLLLSVVAKKNPSRGFKGCRHTEKNKEINRQKHLGKKASIETRLKMSINSKGKFTEQHKRRISKALKNKPKTLSHIQKIIKKKKENYFNGKWFRSSWEVIFVKWCNEKNIEWLYEPKRFKLDSNTLYIPDFYLPKLDIWIEVKGWWNDLFTKKYLLFKKKYKNYIVVDSINDIDSFFTNYYLPFEEYLFDEYKMGGGC